MEFYMLVLRRKVGETIVLDGVISVSVLAVEGERVKLGITAPIDVTIVREELLKLALGQHAQTSTQEVPAQDLCPSEKN
jgi:carbon storage regulator